jgi:hypothetical protein
VIILAPKVHYAEDLGGLGVLYHHHVALGVLCLDGHAEVIAWLVFVSHLKRRLHRGLLPILKRANLPEDYTPHQLRHTCTTLLLSRGVHPKFV